MAPNRKQRTTTPVDVATRKRNTPAIYRTMSARKSPRTGKVSPTAPTNSNSSFDSSDMNTSVSSDTTVETMQQTSMETKPSPRRKKKVKRSKRSSGNGTANANAIEADAQGKAKSTMWKSIRTSFRRMSSNGDLKALDSEEGVQTEETATPEAENTEVVTASSAPSETPSNEELQMSSNDANVLMSATDDSDNGAEVVETGEMTEAEAVATETVQAVTEATAAAVTTEETTDVVADNEEESELLGEALLNKVTSVEEEEEVVFVEVEKPSAEVVDREESSSTFQTIADSATSVFKETMSALESTVQYLTPGKAGATEVTAEPVADSSESEKEGAEKNASLVSVEHLEKLQQALMNALPTTLYSRKSMLYIGMPLGLALVFSLRSKSMLRVVRN